ncbi:hypothetical protein [Arenibacter arenosicollis]|uniref:hypothetical protein n=1 Tax=Arenibacter arenosicollis TaxID=2762274 RepID=UPI001FE999C3|nr:hypothetical protein [Arenibacter arenosicollis]
MKIRTVMFISILTLTACSSQPEVTKQSMLADYQVGEKWVWKYKGVTTAGKVRSDETNTREIISIDGALAKKMSHDTVLVSDIVKPEESETPKYAWPLEVGKKMEIRK